MQIEIQHLKVEESQDKIYHDKQMLTVLQTSEINALNKLGENVANLSNFRNA